MKPKADTKDILKFADLMHDFPSIIRPATTAALNNQAFAMRNIHIPNALDDNFTIRADKFLKRQTRVNMAKKGKAVDVNFSEVGMMSTDRFTGLEEQQTGKAPEKKRTATTDVARGGSFAKKQRPTTRMNRPFRQQSQYRGRSKKHRIFQMMRETQKQKLNFVLKNGEGNQLNIPDGLYGWKGNNLKMLQSFKAPKVHKADWMGDAIKLLTKHQGPFTAVFIREMERLIRKNSRNLK